MYFAIPDFSSTSNTIPPDGSSEPATATCIASAQPYAEMDGTYTTTGSHFSTGQCDTRSTTWCFRRQTLPITPPGASSWLSRTASNNYDATTGNYLGSTSTTVSGTPILGEYVSITAPYSFVTSAYFVASVAANNWTLAGSNDGGSTYTFLHDVSGANLVGNTTDFYDSRASGFTNTTAYSSYILIFTNVPGGGGAALSLWNLFAPLTPCFAKGTRILCEDGYRLVESLRKGTMVKTLKHGYKPITMIGTSTIRNPAHTERIRERLYRYPKHELLLTGGHAVLVDSVNGEQMARIMSSYKGLYSTEGQGRLLSRDDDNAEPYAIAGTYEVYNFVLEGPHENTNYGVYANGLLVESSFRSWVERTMRLIE